MAGADTASATVEHVPTSPTLTPDDATALTATVVALYEDATERVLDTVARRLARGIDQPGWAEQKAAELVDVRRDVRAILADLATRAPEQTLDMLRRASTLGASQADGKRRAGLVATNRRAVLALAHDVAGVLAATQPRVLRWVDDVWRTVLGETVGALVAGVDTRRQAAARALARFAARGVTGFVDRSGRAWRLDSYVEMATRTAAMRASLAGGVDRWQASGRDLVIVSNAPEECVRCRPWEGKVLSLSGRTRRGVDVGGGFRVAGTLREASTAGLLHPNCRHSLAAYIPGLTRRPPGPTADPDGDEQRQRQRALERRVRAAKRQTIAADAIDPRSPAARAARVRVRQAQAELREHVQQHGRKRLRHRESITGPDRNPASAGRAEQRRTTTPAQRDTAAILAGDDLADQTDEALTAALPHADEATAGRIGDELDHRDLVDRARNADLTALSDDDLAVLLAQVSDDPDALARIADELDRRDQAAAPDLPPATDAAGWLAGDHAVDRALDPVDLSAPGVVDPDDLDEFMPDDIDPEDADRPAWQWVYPNITAARAAAREQYDAFIFEQYVQAEDATRGNLVNMRGQAKGVDALALFSGPPQQARAYASDELLEFWARESPRLSFQDFFDQFLGEFDAGSHGKRAQDWNKFA